MNHKEQQGFLTIAANTSETDYLELAYLQALNVKATQRIKSFAIIVDTNTKQQIQDYHKKVFDYIIEIPASTTGPYGVNQNALVSNP